MRRLLVLSLLGSTAAMAQVSGPLVTEPAFMALSESMETLAQRAEVSAFEARDFRLSRNHTRDKAEALASAGAALSAARSMVGTSVNVVPPAAYTQTATFQPLGAPIGANFEALGLGTPGFSISGAPPDTTLAVSSTQIVQWVNSQFAVYSKAGAPLLPAPGFLNGNTIWSALPSGSLCRTFNRGDPIVQFDRIAQRWIFSQFAFNASASANAQCIAVSTTSNAMGAYALYEYSFGADLPDYGKMGLWPDAYYLTYNMFNLGANFVGGRACAYDRARMIAGLSATQICFNSVDFDSFLPSDLDGTRLPPAGAANVHISWNYYNVPSAPYTLRLSKFKPNFTTPALSTFDDGFGGGPFSFVGITLDGATSAACNDSGGTCVPQLGGGQLDTLGDRLMYRLAYRNFGTYESLLVSHAVDVVAGAHANMRWYEIRNPSANPPIVYQNSTFTPNGEDRWMSSGAMDKLGNIGIGYSASSSAINPGIRISGRLKNDPKNQLRTEVVVQAGSGSQGASLSRWGDYSTMQIDPADECTFWYTTQYIGANGTFNWRTRIASFKFPNCN